MTIRAGPPQGNGSFAAAVSGGDHIGTVDAVTNKKLRTRCCRRGCGHLGIAKDGDARTEALQQANDDAAEDLLKEAHRSIDKRGAFLGFDNKQMTEQDSEHAFFTYLVPTNHIRDQTERRDLDHGEGDAQEDDNRVYLPVFKGLIVAVAGNQPETANDAKENAKEEVVLCAFVDE